jgi:hypothetical protein
MMELGAADGGKLDKYWESHTTTISKYKWHGHQREDGREVAHEQHGVEVQKMNENNWDGNF